MVCPENRREHLLFRCFIAVIPGKSYFAPYMALKYTERNNRKVALMRHICPTKEMLCVYDFVTSMLDSNIFELIKITIRAFPNCCITKFMA